MAKRINAGIGQTSSPSSPSSSQYRKPYEKISFCEKNIFS